MIVLDKPKLKHRLPVRVMRVAVASGRFRGESTSTTPHKIGRQEMVPPNAHEPHLIAPLPRKAA